MSNNVKFLNAHDSLVNRNFGKKSQGNLKKTNNPGKSISTKDVNKQEFKNQCKQPLKIANENDINEQNLGNKKDVDGSCLTCYNENYRASKFLMDIEEEQESKKDTKTFEPFDEFKEIKEFSEESDLPILRTNSQNLENLTININLKTQNNFGKDEYREMFSKYVRDDYENSIINSLLNDEQANENFLVHHKITERMRTRMVDWMIEVLSNYHCDESTYFESVNIMDRYFKACEEKQQILQPSELHLIGVTAMFISSKYQDIYPLRLKVVQDKIAHRKLSCQEIKEKEDEITRYLEYSIGLPTVWDFINHYIEEIFFVNYNKHQINSKVLLDNYYNEMETEEDLELGSKLNKLYTKNMLILLKYVCIYLAKMNCHDYSLVQKKPSLLAASTIFVAIKICEQINKEDYVNEYFTTKLNEISQKSENEIIKIAQKILHNAQNFDTLFSGLENLKKVHFNAIIDLKETK